MKTQAIQNQNFNGQLIYVTKSGEKITGEGIRYRLPSLYNTSKKAVADLLRNEPFDLFISRADNPLHFNVKASDGKQSTDNILVKLIKNKYYTEAYHYANSEELTDAIFKSMSEFKKGNVIKNVE